MIRFFDIFFSLLGLVLLSPLVVFLYIMCYFDTGYPIFKQERVGRNKKPFRLYKFRSMYTNTESVATHLASQSSVTRWGSFLRKSKLDELPQLVNVLFGTMSLVGPRPCLQSQIELIEERSKRGVFDVLPGITGLAQIKRVDMSSPKILAEIDCIMSRDFRLKNYFYYIILTVLGKGSGDRILLS